MDIPKAVGGYAAYVGFTGSTGGLYASQDVLSWTYNVKSAEPFQRFFLAAAPPFV